MKRTEETVVELPFIETCKKVGYTYIDGRTLSLEMNTDQRESMKDFFLNKTLKESLIKLNPGITLSQIKEIITILKQTRSNLLEANKELYGYITQGIKLTIDTEKGKRDKLFRIISEKTEENTYNVVNQFKIHGSTENIKPDIILFVNGLPLVLVECKYSGTEAQPITAGLDQIQVYMKKVPNLFHINQILVSTFKDQAKAGSITGFPLYFNEWKDTYPHSINTNNPQETMIYGLLHPDNLTDILFNHINFEGSSKTIPRYQQYRAVRKIMKLLSKKTDVRMERSGLIFHTQRSGKTYTMINLAKTLHKEYPDHKILFGVDRSELESQHLDTFNKTLSQPIKEIDSSEDLKAELRTDASNICFFMIHKFRDDESYPVLNTSDKIIVIIDEAHRSQYSLLGANLNRALPNAAKIGFTGTPLFKNDKSTAEFGSIIDSYTRSEAVADQCTVPLKYENRIPNVNADLSAIQEDESFMLSGLTKEQKDQGIRTFVNQANIYNSKPVIKVICKDIILHYRGVVEPEGFKAMVVTSSKKVAIDYYNTLKELNGPKATIVMSGDHNDPEEMKQFTNPKTHEEQIKNFKDKDGDIKLLIVVDKLLTGFNAPICQTLYFCKKLKEHNLAQAIDRPITPYENKQYGLIIDYCGIRDDLEETIKLFDQTRDQENFYKDIKDDLAVIKEAHAMFMKKASDIDLKDFETSKLRYKDTEKREELFHYYKEFNKAINILLPSQEAIEFAMHSKRYLKFMNELKGLYEQEELSLGEIGEKIKHILNDHIIAEKILTRAVAIDILSPEFITKVKGNKSKELQCAEAEYAIKKYIKTNQKNDPIFFDKMFEKVQSILLRYKDEVDEMLKNLLSISDEIRNQRNYAIMLGIESADLPVLHLLQDFFEKNTNMDLKIHDNTKDRIVPNLLKIKEMILEKKNEQDGLYKETNISSIKSDVNDLMYEFFDGRNEYKLFSDRVELLAFDLIEKYR